MPPAGSSVPLPSRPRRPTKGCGYSFDRNPPHAVVRARERDLDFEEAILVRGAGLVGHHLSAQLHETPERPVLDLDLLIEPPRGRRRPALAGDEQLAAADLEGDVGDVH